jgi:hypothetical protein
VRRVILCSLRETTRTLSLAILIAAVFAAAASRFPVNDGDLFWHLATARWVVDHGALARTDTFSFTAFGAPVPQHEWLSQLLLYAAYAAGSWQGIVALRVIAVLALATTALVACLREAPRPSFAVAAAMPALALSRVDWNDRVELYALVCFMAFVLAAVAARQGHARALVLLPPVFLVWANLHGSFALGVALLVALAAEVAIRAPSLRRPFAVALAATILATVIHPDGPLAYADPVWHFLGPPRFIEEWQPLDVLTASGAIFAIVLVVTAVVALRGGAETHWLALLVPLAGLGFVATRYAPFFVLVAAPYLAGHLPLALARAGARIAPMPLSGPPLGASLAVALALTGAAIASAPREPDLSLYPVPAVSLIGAQDRVFNEYFWGGYLYWATEHPVFVDGRLRPFAGAVIDDYLRAIGARAGWSDVLDRYGVTVVVVKADQPLVGALRAAGWRALLLDDRVAVLRRS